MSAFENEVLSRDDDLVASWITRNLGKISRIERQGRWRPAWYVDVLTDEGTLNLYVRGDRGGDVHTQPQPLTFEYEVLKIFAGSGLRVPRVFGYIEELDAIVMERLPGVPDVRNAATAQQAEAITSQFVDQMILMHQVDPKKIETQGVYCPEDLSEVALAYYRRIEPLYVNSKNRPEPAIEFVRRWLERNKPVAPERAYTVAVDAGQFIFEGDRLTAMLDFEFVALGDYHSDLAVLRLRNRMERIGDLDSIYRQYAERSGFVVDFDRIRYHTVIHGVIPPMHMAENLGKPIADMDYVQYSTWNAVWLRVALESIAEINNWEPEIFEPPQLENATRYSAVVDAMEVDFTRQQPGDELGRYQRDKNLRTLRFLRRTEAFQPAFEQAYLEDVSAITGSAPTNWYEADLVLEQYILEVGPEQDEALLRIFWRQLLRQCFLLSDPVDTTNNELLLTPLQRLDP